ncbi:hypothetical protein FCL40_01180 [Ferrimonas sediminicola]|uniref:Uncharacterized protein n=1 Tax=Ferrimonas sediminicola TaxID=2569538 RepID=A0A4U1BIL0_9GAMM|nr:hypothetical protein [Ferrimonas sediminicola]TKB51199.1 hypothetical protein FCL40_01180 [Ferrimonas sediminicola]
MPRIKKSAEWIHQALDLLVAGQIRLCPQRNPGRYGWLMTLVERVQAKVQASGAPPEQRPYLTHYLLCLLQVEASELHPQASQWQRWVAESARLEGGVTREQIDQLSEYNRDFRRALVHKLLASLMARLGLSFEPVAEMADELMADPELDLSGVAPDHLLDLVLHAYLVEDLLAPLKLLCFASDRGLIDTAAVRPRQPPPLSYAEPILRLHLYREFQMIAHFVWESEFRRGIKESRRDFPAELVVAGKRTPLTAHTRKLEIDLALTETSAGQRLIRSLFDRQGQRDFAAAVSPVTVAGMAEERVMTLLEYAVTDYRKQLFVDEQGRGYRFGRMLSTTCGVHLHYFLFARQSRLGLPIFVGGDDQADSMSSRLARRLRDKLGISIAARTLYQAHRRDDQGLYPSVQRRWRQFALIHAPNIGNWHENQCYCACIGERLAQLSTERDSAAPASESEGADSEGNPA